MRLGSSIARLRSWQLIRWVHASASSLAWSFERERADQLSPLVELLQERPEIQQAYYISGDADLLLIVIVPEISHYDRLTAELVSKHPMIKRITTSVVFRELKVGLFVPV